MTTHPVTLLSKQDNSANVVFAEGFEARYVRREEEYIIVYLSSHTGCSQACRMCFLTQTGQTAMKAATAEDFMQQAHAVLQIYQARVNSGQEPAAKRINFNWMARGEPMLNQHLWVRWNVLSMKLAALAEIHGAKEVAFNISTIMPFGMEKFVHYDGPHQPTIYYSLYSTNEKFRKRWLPRAKPVDQALKILRDWQRKNKGKAVIHHPLIADENSMIEEASRIGLAVEAHDLDARFNLVRYNPYSEAQGREASEEAIQVYFSEITRYMTVPGSRIVPRIGFDVKASCGMFVNEIPVT